MENDPIKHVVVLMMENRSFDHLLGDLKRLPTHASTDGIDHNQAPKSNPSPRGPAIDQSGAALPVLPKKFDPRHEHPNVVTQIGNLAAPTMGGFVVDAVRELGKDFNDGTIAQVMSYFPVASNLAQDPLPALRTLARNFTVCDHWFASLPGPTWPNRFFSLCGLQRYVQPTAHLATVSSVRVVTSLPKALSISFMKTGPLATAMYAVKASRPRTRNTEARSWASGRASREAGGSRKKLTTRFASGGMPCSAYGSDSSRACSSRVLRTMV